MEAVAEASGEGKGKEISLVGTGRWLLISLVGAGRWLLSYSYGIFMVHLSGPKRDLISHARARVISKLDV